MTESILPQEATKWRKSIPWKMDPLWCTYPTPSSSRHSPQRSLILLVWYYSTFNDAGADGKDLYLRSVCFSPDARYLACGAEDRTVKLWNIEKREIEHTFYGHQMDIYSVDYSQDGRFIVSGSGDKKARIWDVEKKKCLFVLGSDEVGPKDGVTSVAISPDGRLIAAGSLDRVVRLWDTHTGYFLERYEGHSDSVYSVAFSPDGKLLASGSLDKTLKLWDLSESRSRSQPRSTFSGHSDFVLSVAFSPDGNWLVSGSKDRTVQFWDPRSTVSHAILEGHTNSGKHFFLFILWYEILIAF